MHDMLYIMPSDTLQEQVQGRGGGAGEEPAHEAQTGSAHSCCGCCTCAKLAHVVFCMFSAVAFFGILVGAPVYVYLVKLPGLACSAAV